MYRYNTSDAGSCAPQIAATVFHLMTRPYARGPMAWYGEILSDDLVVCNGVNEAMLLGNSGPRHGQGHHRVVMLAARRTVAQTGAP